MNAEQAKALREPFDTVQKVKKEWTDEKTGQRKSITLDYIGHAVVTDRLLSVDPSFMFEVVRDTDNRPIVVLEGLARGDSVGVWGVLTILGSSVMEFCSGKDLMDAYSRCLCRCAMRRGVALDLWIKDDEFKAQPEVRTDGPGQISPPRSWTKVRELVEGSEIAGAWEVFDAFVRAASYHLYGETESKKLTADQRKVMLQKAAGAAVWIAENDNTPVGGTWSVDHQRQGWAAVMDGVALEVPDVSDTPEVPTDKDAEEVERLAKLAEETITGPPKEGE